MIIAFTTAIPCGSFCDRSVQWFGSSLSTSASKGEMESATMPLQDQVEMAYEAGTRMMHTKEMAGAKVYHHPLKFKVSDFWLQDWSS